MRLSALSALGEATEEPLGRRHGGNITDDSGSDGGGSSASSPGGSSVGEEDRYNGGADNGGSPSKKQQQQQQQQQQRWCDGGRCSPFSVDATAHDRRDLSTSDARWPNPAHALGWEGRGIECQVDGLLFSSKFCSANLARVERAEGNEFRLWTRKDCEGTDFDTT